MAEGGSNTGRILAGGGCITFLLCFVFGALLTFVVPGVLANQEMYDFVALSAYSGYACCCCSMLGGVGGLAGIVMILMGARSE